MGKIYDGIDERLRAFIESQPVFFVATAPLAGEGHVNISPKGVDGTLAVLDERRIAYLDITASGAETVAHLRENGRITVMFCAFSGPPKIVRLYGTGRVVSVYDDDFAAWAGHFTESRGARAVIVVHVRRIADSCGFGVPLLSFEGERDMLPAHAARKGADGLVAYRRKKNQRSLDGLAAFDDDGVEGGGEGAVG